jgi:RNA polymerase sigma-70 factor (ECF subfamily)
MSTKQPGLDEGRLLSLATQGDKKAFGVLYERYLDEIYRYVYYRIGDQQEAEDITATSFVKTWEYLPKIYRNNPSNLNLRKWLYKVAKNLVIDYYKKKKALPLLNGLHDEQDSTKKEAEHNIQTDELAKAIRLLRPDYQQIIILRFVNRLSHQEVADIMELSLGQTRILQHRALKKLKDLLPDEST